MRIELKQKKKNKWQSVQIEKLKNLSRIDFIEDEFDPTVAAIYKDDDEVGLVIANTEDLKDHYEENGVMFILAKDLKVMLTDPLFPKETKIQSIFPESTLEEIQSRTSFA